MVKAFLNFCLKRSSVFTFVASRWSSMTLTALTSARSIAYTRPSQGKTLSKAHVAQNPIYLKKQVWHEWVLFVSITSFPHSLFIVSTRLLSTNRMEHLLYPQTWSDSSQSAHKHFFTYSRPVRQCMHCIVRGPAHPGLQLDFHVPSASPQPTLPFLFQQIHS